MSIGKKFNKEEKQLTDQERIEVLEAKIPALIERIQAYDEVLEKFKEREQDFEKIQNFADLILAKLEEIHERNIVIDGKLNDFSQENADLKRDLAANLDKTTKGLSNLDSQVKDLQVSNEKRFKSHSENTQKNLNNCVKRQDLEASLQNMGLFQRSALEKMGLLEQKDKQHDETVSSLLNEHDNILKKWEKQNQNLQAVTISLEESKKGFKSEIDGVYEDIERKKSELTEAINTKGQEVKDYVDTTPSSIEYVRKEFNNKMQLIQFDSENAVQKSNNNEKALKIIEKKVESLMLKQKQLELEQ